MHDAAEAELNLAGIQAQGDSAAAVADAQAKNSDEKDTGDEVEAYNKDMDGYVSSGDFQGAAHATAHGRDPNQVVGRFANGGNLAPVEGLLKSEFDSVRGGWSGFGVFDLEKPEAIRNEDDD